MNQSNTKPNPQIFREYDIRGVVEEDLTPDVALLLGKGIGTYLKRKDMTELTLGRDCRLSSDGLRDQILAGLLSTGCNVVDVGVCPTPGFYFSLRHLEKQGGVMITGSHNPAEFNGFKVCAGFATIYGDEIQEVRKLIDAGDFETGAGTTSTFEIIPPYQQYLRENLNITKPLKVVVDAGNGTAGPVGPAVFRDLGCEVIELYCDMDGRFPNHHPDPTVMENLQDLIDRVIAEKADLGIAWDGDADRIGAVDEKGNVIWGDNLMILFARDILETNPGATVISEVKSSMCLYDDIERHGGRAIMWRTGHSLIKKKMHDEKALLAGEMSGHMFFADRYFGYDDAIYASGRLLEIVAKKGHISTMLSDVPKTYYTPEMRIPCPDEKKFDIVARATAYFKDAGYKVNDIDGARIVFDDGWGLVRASNTQPVLVLRCEATTQERLDEIKAMIESKVEEFAG